MTEIEAVVTNPLTPMGATAWNWEIPVYLFLGGITAGLMIFSAILSRAVPLSERSRWSRWAVLGAPIALSLGMLALLLDLEYRTHAFRFYLALEPTSPMSWGSWILLAIYPATVLLGLGQLTDDETQKLVGWGPVRVLRLSGLVRWAHRWGAARLTGLNWTNLAAGIALGAYTGILLGTLGARPVWNSSVLGPLFLVSGVSTGAALMMLFPLNHREHTLLRNWDIGAIVLELALLGALILGMSSGGADARAAGELITGGQFTALFWSLVVVAGLAVPLIVELVEAKKKLSPTLLAPALLLVVGFSLRWILVVAGQTPLG